MVRRRFLKHLGLFAASAAVGSGERLYAYNRRRHVAPSPPPKLDRIALSTWSLHNYFRTTRESGCTLPGPMLVLLDLPEMVYNRFRIRHFEFCASHFPSTEQAYLRELKYVLTHTQSNIVHISVDIDACGPEGTFSDPDREARLEALDMVRRWVDVAHTLGAKSVSVGPGKVDSEFLGRTADSYRAITNYALTQGIHVVVENREGFGDERPADVTKLISRAGAGRLGALPNFAAFSDGPTRTKGLTVLFPLAQHLCHAGCKDSSNEGAERTCEMSEAIQIAKQSGFRGYYSIQFDGPGDPYTGIQRTLEELMEYI